MSEVLAALARHAEETPEKTCIDNSRQALSFSEVWRASCRMAAWLRTQGVGAGDRVALGAQPGDVWFAPAYFGVHLAGAAAVVLDARAADATRAAVLERTGPSLAPGGAELRAILGEGEAPEPERPDPDALSDILFTSGSTGPPKGVMLTYRATAAAARNINAFIGNGPGDHEVVTIPLCHSFGLGRLRCNVLAGGSMTLVPGFSFPALVFQALEDERTTGLSCVPAGVEILMKWGGERLARSARRLRYMELGSSPMSLEAKRALMAMLPTTRICMHYGLTEASRSAFIEFHADANHLDTVGKAAPNVEIEVRRGRIWVRGEAVSPGYWRDPELTARTRDAEGWFDTGDLGAVDADGYLHLAGRADDTINVGGRKVQPETVEALALRHRLVLDAACVGWPDRLLGQAPVLYVVMRECPPGWEDEVQAFLRAGLDPYAAPHSIIPLDRLPRTESGKLQRAVLRALKVDRPKILHGM